MNVTKDGIKDRPLHNIVPYIEGKLFLKVNRDKTKVAHISKVRYLGYALYRFRGKCRLRVHSKSVGENEEPNKRVDSKKQWMGE